MNLCYGSTIKDNQYVHQLNSFTYDYPLRLLYKSPSSSSPSSVLIPWTLSTPIRLKYPGRFDLQFYRLCNSSIRSIHTHPLETPVDSVSGSVCLSTWATH